MAAIESRLVRLISNWLMAASMLVSAGCSTTPAGRGDLLDFIQDGVTTRVDIILRLGEPSATYENSRIMTYRLSRDEGGWFLRVPDKRWYGNVANLVVVFDERSVVTRHSLVQVRGP